MRWSELLPGNGRPDRAMHPNPSGQTAGTRLGRVASRLGNPLPAGVTRWVPGGDGATLLYTIRPGATRRIQVRRAAGSSVFIAPGGPGPCQATAIARTTARRCSDPNGEAADQVPGDTPSVATRLDHSAGHWAPVQVVGTDAAGHRQYLHHPDWRASHGRVKHDRVLQLGAAYHGHGSP